MSATDDEILGALTANSEFAVELPQRSAWLREIEVLRASLSPFAGRGWVFFELVLPRLGRRMDVALVVEHLLFVIEFKVGENEFQRGAIDQVWDYALDLKNFHQSSHAIYIVPVLVATGAAPRAVAYREPAADGVFRPVLATPDCLNEVIALHLASTQGPAINGLTWERGRYSPTPTIIGDAPQVVATGGGA